MKTVADMREVAKRMQITGISRLSKRDLETTIRLEIQRIHGEEIDKIESEKALAACREILRRKGTVKRAVSERKAALNGRKSYNERAISRALTYARQNGYGPMIDAGYDVYPALHYTPKQRRRAAKKYNAQYAKLARKLSA